MEKTDVEVEKMQRLSHLTIEQAVDGIVWHDSEARIHRVNPAMCRMLGYSRGEMLRLKIHDLDPEYPAERFRPFWDRVKKERVVTLESLMRRKDGSRVPVAITVNFIEFEGTEYSCTLVQDITERKKRDEALQKALAELEEMKKRLEAENIYLQEEIKVEHNFVEIIGKSMAFKKTLRQVEQVAPLDTTVLILGETGTGKELLARAVHDLSSRKNRPLVKVNCAALPSNLIESELFGHEQGAFTGATSRKIGRFELADRGTIFLDEIGDLPLELQAKLLRVLQEGEFERLGGSRTMKVDVRVIAATNRDLEKAIEEGTFREDLYYRLHVFPIVSPALRERRDDIPALVKHFIGKYGAKIGKQIEIIPKKVMDTLATYHWPGNIRELENVIERSLILSQSNQLEMSGCFRRSMAPPGDSKLLSLEELERDHIYEVLEKTGWRVRGERGAADILGLKPTTLEARMKKLEISRKRL